MSADYAHDQLVLPNAVRGLGMPFIMVPLNIIATAGIEREQVGSASGLLNVLRNLGGSVGISSLATFITVRQHFHSNRVVEAVSLYDPNTVERLDGLQQYFAGLGADPGLAQEQALRAMAAAARQQSSIMAFNDAFYVIGVAFIISLLFIYLMKKPTPA
jgi:DHA2 family multidrug resistance protein